MLLYNLQFFPEANEVQFARKSVFGGASIKLDYLTKPSLFEDFGFVSKVKMVDRVKPEDELFLVAYPYFNVNGSLKLFLEVNIQPVILILLISYAIQRCLWSTSFTKKLW